MGLPSHSQNIYIGPALITFSNLLGPSKNTPEREWKTMQERYGLLDSNTIPEIYSYTHGAY